MSRLRADLLLALAGLIWGFGFVAQKDAAAHIGPFTFVASRFLISVLFTLPFALREGGLRRFKSTFKPRDKRKLAALCASFIAAVTLQQIGIVETTVTNAAFITGIYIVLVPFAAWFLYRERLSFFAVIASVVSLIGVMLLTAADPRHVMSDFNRGDIMILLCAVCFSLQVTMLGHIVGALKIPLTLSLLQYTAITIVTIILALIFETIDAHAILAAWWPILFSGIAAGGIAYTLQAVAQQHTPAADAAIIMSSETLFGAIGGIWLLHETLNLQGYLGCAAILAAILLVELAPLLRKSFQTNH